MTIDNLLDVRGYARNRIQIMSMMKETEEFSDLVAKTLLESRIAELQDLIVFCDAIMVSRGNDVLETKL